MPMVYDDNTGNYVWEDDEVAYDPPPAAPTPVNGTGVPINGNNPAGYQDLSYWQSRGVNPDEIFNTQTGQIHDNFIRTARGYELRPLNTSGGGPFPTGSDVSPIGGPSFTGGPQLRSLSDLWPSWSPPQFSGMTFQAPPEFSYEDFRAPSLEEAESEPGYAFAAQQGRKQVESTKAAQGVYRSGQTLKDIYAWASEYAKQNYGGAFDRKLQVYGTNRNNAAENYMTNYGVSRDVFDRNYGSSRDVFDRNYNSYQSGFDSARRKAELDYARDWDLYQSDIDVKKTLYNGGAD